MAVEILSGFYPRLPINGVTLANQWENFRNNFALISTLIRSSYADLSPNGNADHDLSHTVYGELDASKRFRVGYDKSTDCFVIQFNTGTQAVPVWVDYFRIRQSDGQVQAVGSGGFTSTGGFYGLNIDRLQVSETVSGNPIFNSVSSLKFNTSSGFYLTPDGAGNPVVNFVDTSGAVGESNTASNVGSGSGVFKQKSGVDLQFKSLTAGINISLTSSTNEIQISAPGAGGFYGILFKESEAGGRVERDDTLVFDSTYFYLTQAGNDGKPLLSFVPSSISGSGETNTASNLGAGTGLFAQKVGVDLQFKSLTAGTGISFNASSTEVQISSSASGGGFYGVIFKESQAGGRIERDDTLVFDSTYFYLTQAGNDGKPLLSFIPSSITGLGESNTASNVGSGSGVFKQKSGVDLQFKSLVAGSGIAIANNTNDLTLSIPSIGDAFYGINVKLSNGVKSFKGINTLNFEASNFYIDQNSPNTDEVFIGFRGTGGSGGSGETNTASNLGAGTGLFAQKVGVDLQFKSLTAGSNISFNTTGTEVQINSSASGGSGGGFYLIVAQSSNIVLRAAEKAKLTFNRQHFYLTPTSNNTEVMVNLSTDPIKRFVQRIYSGAKEWIVSHNLNTTDLVFTTYDNRDRYVIPSKVDVSNPNTAFFYFFENATGKAILIG